jgi:hypothetical protein
MERSIITCSLFFLTITTCSSSEFEFDYTYPSDRIGLHWVKKIQKLEDHHKQEAQQQHTKEKSDLAAEKNRNILADESSAEESCSCFYGR